MTAGLETFAKVRALHDRASTPGEKAAAAGRMEALARTAGMTVAEAVSKLDRATTPAQPRSFFEDLFNTPEFKAQKAERDRKDAEKRREVLKEYGSEEAVWEPCERERALEEACQPFITREQIIGGEMDTLMGWTGGPRLPEEVSAVVSVAIPLPDTLAGIWEEYRYWEKRFQDQVCFCPDIDHPLVVRARREILEELLDNRPAKGMRDLRARLDWWQCVLDWNCSRPVEKDQAFLNALRDDVERMGARIREQDGTPTPPVEVSRSPDPATSPVQFGQEQGASRPAYPSRRTNAEKRSAVLDLLGFSLSDREIARRAGVSPQTVGNIRRTLT